MQNKLLAILFLFQILIHGCWDKQDNEVVAPEPAFYMFTGNVVDLANGNSLEKVTVTMKEVELSETSLDSAISFGTKLTQTDSEGQFFFDSVYVGRYTLCFEREGRIVDQRNFLQSYSAREEVFEIPRVFSEGIKWTRDKNTLLAFHSADSISISMSTDDQSIVFYSFIDNAWVFQKQFTNPVPNSFDIDVGKNINSIWTISNNEGEQKVYELRYSADSGWTHSPLPEEKSAELTPIAVSADSDILWVSSLDRLYAFSLSDLSLTEQLNVPDGIIATSIEQQDDVLWLFDKNRQYLYQTDLFFGIKGIYVVFIDDETPRINDFGIDHNGQFWFITN